MINKYSMVSDIQTSFEQDINPIRKHRWDKLNLVLKNNKKAKVVDGEFTSSNYSSITWKEVGPIFNSQIEEYTQEIADLPNDVEAVVISYLEKVSICFKDLSGNEAKRLYFITPIIVALCSAFNGEVTILVEEDLKGGYIEK